MMRYQGAGLRDVWLVNGYREVKTSYGKAVTIADLPGLHRTIGLALAAKRAPLTGAELRYLRKELGLSQRALADALGCEEQTVSLWERRGRLPKMADRFVRAIYRERAEGNAGIADLVERLKTSDDAEDSRTEMRFAKRGAAWKVAA
jgi:DNA-binding transcriptional regulator YiaG